MKDDFGSDVYALKRFDNDTRVATVYPITFGRARLSIAQTGSQVYEDTW